MADLENSKRLVSCILLFTFLSVFWQSAFALDLQPRRWGHLPLGVNFMGVGYVRSEGDILLDPILRAEDVEVVMDTWAFNYVHSFKLFDKSANFSLLQGYQEGTWTGLLEKVPTTARRNGASDTFLRLAVNLYGAPPLRGKAFQEYRSRARKTTFGVALGIQLPTGNYEDDKLINLGGNRYVFRPQMGVVHETGKWVFEATGTVWLYTKNDDFFNGNKLEQDPLYTFQSHIIHNHRPGMWTGLSLGYSYGGESEINGIDKDDRKRYFGWALNFGFPISRKIGLKFGYLNLDTRESTGSDTESITVGIAYAW